MMTGLKHYVCKLNVPQMEVEVNAEDWYVAVQDAAPRLINKIIRDPFKYIECEEL